MRPLIQMFMEHLYMAVMVPFLEKSFDAYRKLKEKLDKKIREEKGEDKMEIKAYH